MARYKVGDKVWIKENIDIGDNGHKGTIIVGRQIKHRGKTAEIKNVRRDACGTRIYFLDVDDRKWGWYNYCFETAVDWDMFETGALRIKVYSKKAYKRLQEAFIRRGYRWRSGDSILEHNYNYFIKLRDEEQPYAAFYYNAGGVAGMGRLQTEDCSREIVWR